jgi:hypothetical protein
VSKFEVVTSPLPLRPRWIGPSVDPGRFTEQEWRCVEEKFLPLGRMKSVSVLSHHLVNWGMGRTFPGDAGAISGPEMLAILAEGRPHPLFASREPLIYRGFDGRPKVARSGEDGSEAHPNQTLSTLASLGVASGQRLRFAGDETTVAELVKCARADFHVQGEVEWSIIALARYAPTDRPWRNRWGGRVQLR